MNEINKLSKNKWTWVVVLILGIFALLLFTNIKGAGAHVKPPEDQCKNIEGFQWNVPDGYHQGHGIFSKWCFKDKEEEVTPTPTPEVTCTENCGTPPTFAGSSTEAPVCSDGTTTTVVANPHVIRNGSSATVNFFITEGNSANIYYKEVGADNWQHSVSDVQPNGDRFVSYTINDLNPSLGYTFGIQQKQGCGGGEIVTSVIVDGPSAQTFGLSYYSW